MKIVNIIPHAMSGESHQDSSPSIAVNPSNPKEIVISALTPDPNNGPNAPIFISTDGGTSWSLKNILPGDGPEGSYGITLKFGHSGDALYAGMLNLQDKLILRTTDPIAGAPMSVLDASGQGGFQQPYVAAITVPAGPDAGKDRLYVGMNDTTGQAIGTSGLTTVIRQTMDAKAAAPVFTNVFLDVRPKGAFALQDLEPAQNGPQVRPAVHSDGTVYAVFYSWKFWADEGNGNGLVKADVVIVRDDNWGQSPAPYRSLVDSGDGLSGQRIAIDVPYEFYDILAQERTGGELAIAVDPTNSSVVYVAWSEQDYAKPVKLHLVRSTDRGQTWSKADLLFISNGKNPALAINDKGQVGFLYQNFTGPTVDGPDPSQRWETHVAFSEDAVHWTDTLLATVPADKPLRQFFPYIGDYTNIMAVGDTFYGVFCANNTPSLANFPQGVKYQRNHNFATATLTDVHGAPVAPSIDPFFFQTPFIAPSVQQPPNQNTVAEILLILFGIIAGGGGAYVDGQGHVHYVGPGDPGPVWEYLVSLAQYRLATASDTRAGLEMQKLALQNIVDMANRQMAQINGRLGQ